MPAKFNKGTSPKRLFYKYNIDTWGHYLMKRNFKNRAARKVLFHFEGRLRFGVVKLLRPFKFYRPEEKEKLQRKRRRQRQKLRIIKRQIYARSRQKKPPFQFSRRTPAVTIPRKLHKPKSALLERRTKPLRRAFFKNLFKYYAAFKRFGLRENKLLSYWSKSHLMRVRRKIPSFLYHSNKRRQRTGIRRLFVPWKRSYVVKRKLSLLRYQQYLCLPTVSQTKTFLRRQEYNFFKKLNDPAFMGMEGNIVNLIFRTGLFPTARFGYFLIKIGAVNINGYLATTPRRALHILDTFTFDPRFIRVIFWYFRRRLQKRLVLVNAPAYLSCNYRVLAFKIWRRPTSRERNFLNSFPFWRSPVDLSLEPLTPEVFVDPEQE